MGVARRNGDFYIVTEWVDGGNLRTLTKDKNDTFTWSNKVSIARDIAVAMAFLHGRGIIHRYANSTTAYYMPPLLTYIASVALPSAET